MSVTMHVSSPVHGSTVTSPVQVSASAISTNYPITEMHLFVDGKAVSVDHQDNDQGNSIMTMLTLDVGNHTINIHAVSADGVTRFNKQVFITVVGS